jgi:hypothetical protein
MTAVAGWQDLAPLGDHHPATRVAMIEDYLDKHSGTLDRLEIERIQGHLARATEALNVLDEEREAYLAGLPHTD